MYCLFVKLLKILTFVFFAFNPNVSMGRPDLFGDTSSTSKLLENSRGYLGRQLCDGNRVALLDFNTVPKGSRLSAIRAIIRKSKGELVFVPVSSCDGMGKKAKVYESWVNTTISEVVVNYHTNMGIFRGRKRLEQFDRFIAVPKSNMTFPRKGN